MVPGRDAQLRRARPDSRAGSGGRRRRASSAVVEDGTERVVTHAELRDLVARARAGLAAAGVGRGDRVVALVPNSVETLVAFLATASLGAVWSSCSPDFGARAVLDRFAQIEPTVLVAVDGYRYNGRAFDIRERVAALQKALPTLKATVLVPHLEPGRGTLDGTVPWAELTAAAAPLEFTPVPFDHPLWVLYSSGTTGLPKGIVQSHGGIVVEHLKALALHYDLGPGDRFLWFTTTGWTMWNFLVGGLLVGATVVLYDGSPGHPDLDVLWAVVERQRVAVFGCRGALGAVVPEGGGHARRSGTTCPALRTLGSTGSPLAPEQFAMDRRGGGRARADLLDVRAARTSARRSSSAPRRCRCGWASCRARRWAPTSTPSTRRASTSGSATTRRTSASW